jgi:curli biogenesis system outer membrane secretion channel CsgG
VNKKFNLILFLACLGLTIGFGMCFPVQAAPYDRPSVAVIPFDDGAIRGPQRWWDRRWEVGREISAQFSTALVNTGKFSLISSTYIGRTLKEQRSARFGPLDPLKAARLGKVLGARLIIIGEVTEFSNNPKGSSKILRKARVAINARMIDVRSGRVISTASVHGDKLGIVHDFHKMDMDSYLFSKTSLGNAVKTAVDQLAEKLIPKGPFPFGGAPVPPRHDGPPAPPRHDGPPPLPPGKPIVGKVIFAKMGSVDINVGDYDRVRPGMNFKVYRIIDTFNDPRHGKVLITDSIAKITVVSVQLRTATCRIISDYNRETRVAADDIIRQTE